MNEGDTVADNGDGMRSNCYLVILMRHKLV